MARLALARVNLELCLLDKLRANSRGSYGKTSRNTERRRF